MTEIWPSEVSRKIRIQNRFQIFRNQARREKSRQNQVDLGVDLAQKPMLGLDDLVHLVAHLGLVYWPVTDFEGSDLS